MTTTKRSPVLPVNVLMHHIELGIKRKSKYCMVAEAIKETYPLLSHVSVDLQSIRITDRKKGVRYIYLTPRIVQKALIWFDQGKKMRSFSFKLKGAHTVAASVINRDLGKPVRKRIKLGKRRLITDGRSKPDVIGGAPPPRERHPNARALRHPSSNSIREFGMGQFTDEERATWPPKGTGLTYDD